MGDPISVFISSEYSLRSARTTTFTQFKKRSIYILYCGLKYGLTFVETCIDLKDG